VTSADVLLATGEVAVLRTVEPADAAALHDLHDRVSDEALWFRFFSVARRAAHDYVDHVLRSPETIALAAVSRGRLVALATAEPVGPDASEVAFLVDDEHRGLGLATLLLEHLAAAARDRGIRRFRAEVLAGNHHMLGVFADAGFRLERRLESGVQVLELPTSVDTGVQAAADAREFASEARSLAPMLQPRAVAVYGVRRDRTGIGAAVLTGIRDGGFHGPVVAVHPTLREVGGVPAYASLVDAEGPIDLAVIAVPVERVLDALVDAADAGVAAAVIISSGFGEMGERGAELQHELSAVARARGVRVVGPNCLGLVCNDPAVRLNASFGGAVPPSGGLAVASQSGGVGIVLMDLVAQTGVGVRYFVSLGNKADVSSNDLLAAWYDDPAVTCGALYLESFGNARKFARFARRFTERKPLVAVVGGRSASGQRAGASHTAAAASSAVGVRALFAQAGVIACSDAEELAESSLLLTREPLPTGRRVAIISNAGGLGVLAADAAEDAGLDVVEFSPPLRERIAGMVNQTTGTANPVDAGAGAEPEQLGSITDAVLASEEVDAVVAVLVATGTNDLGACWDVLSAVRQRHPDRPVVAVALGGTVSANASTTMFRSAAAAMGALGRAASYAEWRRTTVVAAEPTDAGTVRAARDLADRLLSGNQHDGWIAPEQARDLLATYGVEIVGRVVRGADRAAEAAADLGLPAAVKLAEADVVHKTEHGLVRTGLVAPDDVRAVVAGFETTYGADCAVLVQPMVSGVELALGVIRDRAMGPMVMVAAGGVATDVWDDHAFLLPPFDDGEALRALRSLRTWPLLDGFRGSSPAAVDDIARLVGALGRLAVDVPEVAELDLNPVMVGPDGCHVVDAKLRLALADVASRDLPRQLRPVR